MEKVNIKVYHRFCFLDYRKKEQGDLFNNSHN